MNKPLDFELIFQALPGNYLILLPDAPTFTIVAFNQRRAAETFTREAHLGMGVFEAFPDNPDDPNANGVAMLRESLQTVIRGREPHRMAVQKYDIPAADGKSFEERYWLAENRPILDHAGTVQYIIHSVVDITEREKAMQREITMQHNFQSLFSQSYSPFALFTGNEVTPVFMNSAFSNLFPGRIRTGAPLLHMIPELRRQPFYEFLHRVIETGLPYMGMAVEVKARFDEDREDSVRYFNLNYSPYKNNDGMTEGVLVSAVDVSQSVRLKFDPYLHR